MHRSMILSGSSFNLISAVTLTQEGPEEYGFMVLPMLIALATVRKISDLDWIGASLKPIRLVRGTPCRAVECLCTTSSTLSPWKTLMLMLILSAFGGLALTSE